MAVEGPVGDCTAAELRRWLWPVAGGGALHAQASERPLRDRSEVTVHGEAKTALAEATVGGDRVGAGRCVAGSAEEEKKRKKRKGEEENKEKKREKERRKVKRKWKERKKNKNKKLLEFIWDQMVGLSSPGG